MEEGRKGERERSQRERGREKERQGDRETGRERDRGRKHEVARMREEGKTGGGRERWWRRDYEAEGETWRRCCHGIDAT